MTSQQTAAIVLQVRDYGEADRLVTFLTPERGRLTGIAKHAKRSRRRFAHCLEPLSRVEFFLSPRSSGGLEFIDKGELVQSFPGLRRDLSRLGAAALLAELAGELAAPPDATWQMFAAVERALERLEAGEPPDSLLPASLVHLLKLGGYGLHLDTCHACGQEPAQGVYFSIPQGGVLCGRCFRGGKGPLMPLDPGTWKLLKQAAALPVERLSVLRFPGRQRDQSLRLIKLFVRHHLGQDLKSWTFWEKVAKERG